MKRVIALLVSAGSLCAESATKHFDEPCKKALSSVVRFMVDRHFTPSAIDRDSGIASFKYDGGDHVALFAGVEKDVKAYTMVKPNFFNLYKRFRIDSATAIGVDSDNESCDVSLKMNFSGWDNSNFHRGWYALPSNGRYESALIAQIQVDNKAGSK